jgi:dTDP-4-dehydrorhamnose reductase
MAPRLLIAGGSGTLGGPLAARAVDAGWDVVATYLTRPERVRAGIPVHLDLRDLESVRGVVAAARPDVIIHAAVTERSGAGFDTAIRLAGLHLAQTSRDAGIRLVALSTDLVFDGTLPVYTEDSLPQPAANNIYGQAKAQAEAVILACDPAALVVRTSLIYDFDPENAQAAWMLRAVERGDMLHLFTDQFRCPIWVNNLADALLELAALDTTGLLHVVGPQLLSRYDLGTALLAALGYDSALHVTPASAPDTHPKILNLSIERARSILNTPLLTLAQASEPANQ